MSEHKCDGLQQIMGKWERPFYYPVYVEKETLNLKADHLAVPLYNMTASGGIARTGKSVLFLSYCPICGESLTQKEETE
jgi:hypothetical protein